ncbi:MAG: ABC transporter ATP-binding protein [Promethearchaeota archaeon]
MGATYALTAEGLSKTYNGMFALKDVNFTWAKGILGLIGPNGAGKSTLIKIISTLIRPKTGSATVFGKDVLKESFEVRQRIGVLHENPYFHPNLRVLSSLIWVGELRGLSSARVNQTVCDLLEFFDLASVKRSHLKELSAGMRQKYGLIHATIGFPPLIILDEPTSNLDPEARRKYETYVTKLSKEHQCSFLISSHVLGELNRICDGYIFLFNGEITEAGKRDELILKSSSQRFRLVTQFSQQLVPLLVDFDIEVEQIGEGEIIVVAKNYKELLHIKSQIPDPSLSSTMEIYALETEIDSLFRELHDKHKVRGD